MPTRPWGCKSFTWKSNSLIVWVSSIESKTFLKMSVKEIYTGATSYTNTPTNLFFGSFFIKPIIIHVPWLKVIRLAAHSHCDRSLIEHLFKASFVSIYCLLIKAPIRTWIHHEIWAQRWLLQATKGEGFRPHKKPPTLISSSHSLATQRGHKRYIWNPIKMKCDHKCNNHRLANNQHSRKHRRTNINY